MRSRFPAPIWELLGLTRFVTRASPKALPATFEARAWVRNLDPTLECADGFISRFLGLSMYAPMIDESDLNENEVRRPGESFMVFKPGYFVGYCATFSTTTN